MFDIVGKRYWYFLLSALVLVPGLIALLLWGLNLSIDFTGGALLELQFQNPAKVLQPAEITSQLSEIGYPGSLAQSSSDNVVLIRTKALTQDEKNTIEHALETTYGPFVENRFESVGPSVGEAVTQRAVYAVAMAAVGILLYLAFAFRHVPNPFRYGTAAILAMLHDVFVVLGLAALAGHFLHWEVDALFLTALLTVIGFSVHDTIVVFDRIRENMRRHRGEPFADIVNHSIIQTLDRSINTQLTALFTLVALSLFGGVTIKQFVLWLIIGIVSGTYSSIFNASQILVVWENKEYERFLPFLRRGEQKQVAA
ncbi:MAG: protein translocase subunit SecF [Ardenticatenaceae bacterium]|nr:protein translocase subunit SecF [Ardenticatenaceae bacterium]HBY96182.1 protein translocase subunit SecF [Chloroflexota bacterium]